MSRLNPDEMHVVCTCLFATMTQVASHSDASFLASTALAATGELVAKAADKIADSLHLNGPSSSSSVNTAYAVTESTRHPSTGAAHAHLTASPATRATAEAAHTTTVIIGPSLAMLDAAPGPDKRSKLPQQHKGYKDIYTHSVKPTSLQAASHTGGTTLPAPAATGATAGPDAPLDSQDASGVPDGLKTLLQHTGTQQPSRIIIRPIQHLP